MDDITTIGLDIAKNAFQLHGVDAQGQIVLCKLCAVPRWLRSSQNHHHA